MAATLLSDMIIPERFLEYSLEQTAKTSRFRSSGIVTDLTAILEGKLGGNSVNMPFFQDYDDDDDERDDTADISVTNIGTSKDVATMIYRDKARGASDLSAEVAGADPMGAIAILDAAYWARKEQAVITSVLEGAFGAASMADNVLDISALTGGAELFDGESFLDATGKLGAHQDDLAGVAVHPHTYTLMKKQDLIDFTEPSDGEKRIPYYQEHMVVVDNQLPVDTGVDTGVYTTYIFGPGAIGTAEAPVKMPVELHRDPLKNGGMEMLIRRRNFIMHPRGVKWKGTPVGASVTNAELATGTNWERVYEAENVRIVQFKHKLA